MNLSLKKNTTKIIAYLCLIIYITLISLSNIGATLCFGTNLNRHIGIHALSYDSCPDGNVCIHNKTRCSYSDSKEQLHFGNLQINLNKIPSVNVNKIIANITYIRVFSALDIFEDKTNKINWDIYDKGIKSKITPLKNVVLII